MIAPPETDITMAGIKIRIRAADTAVDIMEADVFHASNAHEYMSSVAREQDVRSLQRWCAAHVVSVEGEDWGALADGAKRNWLDCYLDWPDLKKMREQIVDLSSMPKKTLEQLREFWKIAASGGCDCPVCEGRVEPTIERRERWCLYAKVDASIERIVSATSSMQDVAALDAPWWLYQVQQARALGKAQARVEQDKKDRRKKSTRDKLKSRGLM